MKKMSRSLFFLTCVALVIPETSVAGDVVNVHFTPAVREYCHVLRFPSGWQMPPSVREQSGSLFFPLKFALNDNYEFRVRGLLGTRFLVRGVEEVINKYYTSNIYEADLSDPSGVAQPASEEEWHAATVVAVPYETFADGVRMLNQLSKHAGFRGLEALRNGGKGKSGMSISPDRALLVVLSWSGTNGRCGGTDVPGLIDFSCIDLWGPHGKLFFDVYNADTLKKLVTITAGFHAILSEEAIGKTSWLTERYFLMPLDERRERCLVCDFGRREP